MWAIISTMLYVVGTLVLLGSGAHEEIFFHTMQAIGGVLLLLLALATSKM